MDAYSNQINKLIEELSKLPGIGAKSAQRLAFHIINMPKDQVQNLAGTIVSAREKIRYCSCCWNLTDSELCPICANPKRDHHVIMVVETPRDLAAYEKTQKYEGVYHVLHGAISPMLGIGPSDIRLKELMTRLQGDVTEVIIATNSTLEGETTAMYISNDQPTASQDKDRRGVPVARFGYIDEVTLLSLREELNYKISQ
ncbi:MAG: recombination mediator RecR [Coprococcus sp.]